MQIEECFQVLEVPVTASPDEVRKSYRVLVNVWHPDRFAGNETLRVEAERKLARINEAFRTLEAAGFPQARSQEAASVTVASTETVNTEPIAPPVRRTIWVTSVIVLSVLFWLALADKSAGERLFASVFAGFIAGSAFSTALFHIVWSLKSRPRTWIVMTGTLVVSVALLLDKDPSLAPVLFVLGFLGALLLVFVLFYVRSRPTQSEQTRIWNRLVMFGFLVMLGAAGLFMFLSRPALAIAVSWLYWFGWTWISWLVAGRLALRNANV